MTTSIPMNDAHVEEQQTNGARLPRKSARSGSAERQAGLVGSPKERQAILAARAAADLSPQAKERRRIARDLAGRARLVIEPDAGYAQAPAGALPGAESVIASALVTTAGIGHDQVDTSRCFHFGSRVQESAPPRLVAMFQYLTPYAFTFETSHREEAPYRALADGGTSRWTQLLLGAA